MPEGYDTSEYVFNNYDKIKTLLAEMQEGELVDLIGRIQTTIGCKEDKAREYAFGAISSRWATVTNGNVPISTLQAKKNLKHLLPAHFKSNLNAEEVNLAREKLSKLEKRFNVEAMRHELMPEEEPPEGFMDYAKKKQRLREINEARQKMGLEPVDNVREEQPE